MRSLGLVVLFGLGASTTVAQAPGAAPRPANRPVVLDKAGVVRWKDDGKEVALFGANYVITTASDYRAAGYVHGDRKKMIEEDMAQFARMGWDGIRLTFWGDWESADTLGNLIANDHLDLLDWLIAKARERGIYMLFSPIQLYGSNWPDALSDTTAPGFGRKYDRGRIGTDPDAIAAQVNYLRQILNHVNPYTGVALKDEPGILFVELINEPWHHPEDIPGSIRYINTLTDAVRSTGCSKLIFYNVSQDFAITPAIVQSKAQGVTFGWYPTGLVSGHELQGNYLRGVDAFPDMLRPDLARIPRIVYEFDSPDTRNSTMYPAMARTFRSVGAQFAAMFAYDMLQTASRNLGWQTHYLNLVYTPRKAMSAVLAAEAMRRLPRMQSYGRYPGNTRFGDFRISADSNLAELVAKDAFIYAGSTGSTPPDLKSLRRIAGYGSSPVVKYEGEGTYFLDQIREGVWRLEVYPDALPLRDPFEPPNPVKIVTHLIWHPWRMTINLPDLGGSFTAKSIVSRSPETVTASNGQFNVSPGVYLLSQAAEVDQATLPAFVGHLRFDEYHVPDPIFLWPNAEPLVPPAFVAGKDAVFSVRITEYDAADSVKLFLRRTAGDWYHSYWMSHISAYQYSATVPARELSEGPYEFVVARYQGKSPFTYPGAIDRIPWDWDYFENRAWKTEVVSASTALTLFAPAADAGRLTFTRIGDAGRTGVFRLGVSPVTGAQVFHLELPSALPDYTASLVVLDRTRARGESIRQGKALAVRFRGLGPSQTLHLTLMEDDGTSWTAALSVGDGWIEKEIPLSDFKLGRGALLPQGFPGAWNYWVGPADGRGGSGDGVRLDHLERLQLSLRGRGGAAPSPGSYGVEVEWVRLTF